MAMDQARGVTQNHLLVCRYLILPDLKRSFTRTLVPLGIFGIKILITVRIIKVSDELFLLYKVIDLEGLEGGLGIA
jgi:hypothetical protein